MTAFLVAVGLQLLGGVAAVAARRSRRWPARLAVGGIVLGGVLGLVPTIGVLLGGPARGLDVAWDVPFGAFAVGIDALSAFFLMPTLGLSAVVAVYGGEYLRAHERDEGASWLLFALLVVSIETVLIARNAVLFLVAWEVMALSSFFLVTTDHDDAGVREAGWTYLVATHLGTACLLAMFVLLGGGVDPLDFARFPPTAHVGAIFLLAVAGFGAKAGFVPFHVWLPEAHPAAPSHVSALMSGVMIKTGIYGLLRVLLMLGPLPAWCGWLLVAVGIASGVLGILSALVQEDVKRVLAYSSIENVGIVALGLGLGLVGLHAGAPGIAVLAVAAALLHVVNHAVMKGLLFLVAGAVVQQAHTRRLDRLGGLLRRLPRTGVACLVGSAAIAGLPPLAGFASELLLYLAAYRAVVTLDPRDALPAVAAIAALGLVGGLAAACFARLYGIAFLGAARSDGARRVGEPGRAMQGAMAGLAVGCVVLGVASPLLVPAVAPVVTAVTALPPAAVRSELDAAAMVLAVAVGWCLGFLVLAGAIAIVRRALLSARVDRGLVWDCGYAAPPPRAQYTAASFAQPLAAVFGRAVATTAHGDAPKGFFPARASLAVSTSDLARDRVYRPIFEGVGRALASFRWLQHGQVQLYVLYIALTLVTLLLWRIGPG